MGNNIELFKKIASQYECKITEKEDCIEITANNLITSYYESGKIYKQKVVPCFLGLKQYGNHENFYGHEKTHEILGGFATTFTEERFLKELKRYNFKKIASEQLNLF